MTASILVEVVAAEGVAWEGDAASVIVRTTEGDVGILPMHEPFLAALVPCAAVISKFGGGYQIVAVDGGFVSVADNRVSILAGYALVAEEIDGRAAERELAELQPEIEKETVADETWNRFHRAQAKVKAAQLVAEKL